VPNRGNRLLVPAFHVGGDPGDGFFFNRGDIILSSGWQGDVRGRPGAETITVPVAKNRDGSSITGPVLARFSDVPKGATTLPSAYAPASLDTSRATLTRRASEDGAVVPLAPGDWAFADCRTTPFPGTPDPTRVSIKGGFDPAYLYELVYTAKDPPVLGIGLAATHDVLPRSISFTGAMQTLEAFQPLLEGRAARDAAGRLRLYHDLLDAIASHRVADRPDRYEPRRKKRRRSYYDWLTSPRSEVKRKMAKGLIVI